MTAQALALREGAATLGVWLPLAVASIHQALFLVARLLASNPEALKIPDRSDLLREYSLPLFAEALAADEREAEARAMLDSVVALGRATGAKVEVKEGGAANG